MNQLIEVISDRPMILFVLISWPILLWVGKVVSQKVLFSYENKKQKN